MSKVELSDRPHFDLGFILSEGVPAGWYNAKDLWLINSIPKVVAFEVCLSLYDVLNSNPVQLKEYSK